MLLQKLVHRKLYICVKYNIVSLIFSLVDAIMGVDVDEW